MKLSLLRRFSPSYLGDLLLLGGAAAALYGITLIYLPAAWIVGGTAAAVIGWKIALAPGRTPT